MMRIIVSVGILTVNAECDGSCSSLRRLQRRAALDALAHERRARCAGAHVAARAEHHRGGRLRAHHALADTLPRRDAGAACEALLHLQTFYNIDN